MSDDRYLDDLGGRAAAAVRERADDVARRTGQPEWLRDAPPRSRRIRRWTLVAAAAAAIAAVAVVGTSLLQPSTRAPVVGPVPDGTPTTRDDDRSRPSEPVPTASESEEPVPSLLDSGTQDAWYMTADGYHDHIDGRHDAVCDWVRAQLPDDDVPAYVDSSTHRRLHEVVNRELTYPSDGLPIAVGSVCGVLDASPPDVLLDGYEPMWWDDPPYPWQQRGPDPLQDVADTLRALSGDTLDDGSPAYTDPVRFREHADRSGGPAILCRWLHARVPNDALPRGGEDWDAEADRIQAVIAERHPGGPGVNEVLSFVCGYLDPTSTRVGGTTDGWWRDPPYPWGDWRPAPPRATAGPDDRSGGADPDDPSGDPGATTP